MEKQKNKTITTVASHILEESIRIETCKGTFVAKLRTYLNLERPEVRALVGTITEHCQCRECLEEEGTPLQLFGLNL